MPSQTPYEPEDEGIIAQKGKPIGGAASAMLAGLKKGIKQKFEPLKDQLKQDEIKAILASKDCPKARTFGEMIPLAYTISKKNIQTQNTNLCHLPYDKYRVIRDDGTEEIPPDVFANTYEGRQDYAREVLECNMRNLVRLKIMEKLGITQENVNSFVDNRVKKKSAPSEQDSIKKEKRKQKVEMQKAKIDWTRVED